MPGCFRTALYLRAAVSARSTTSTRLKMVMTCDRAEPSTVTRVVLEEPSRGQEGQGPALPPSAQLGPRDHSSTEALGSRRLVRGQHSVSGDSWVWAGL